MSDKLVWIDAQGSWNGAKEKVTGALESGANAVLVSPENVERVRELGKMTVAAAEGNPDIRVIGIGSEGDGTLFLPHDLNSSEDMATAKALKAQGTTTAAYVRLAGKEYEQFAARMGKLCDYLIIEGDDWKVIPLENLIAELGGSGTKILAKARDIDEASVALQTLEKGADGVLVDVDDPLKVREIARAVSTKQAGLGLTPVTITAVRDAGTGDRVCIDTCSLMTPGEGMLIGNQSSGLFLVQSEAEESPYVASRPFRVNAGAVHEYVLVGEKTRYLSELASGDPALIVTRDGDARKATIGRVKIERRPLLYVEAETGDRKISAILQNAETIKLVAADGSSTPVTALKPGDRVLAKLEKEARHFGMKIEETIVEK
ncbi:3-dehydroquinate synthase II [Methanocella arvoryzae]|uniref:3-dehydroquinate synthase n=1 Tax=Methanocella arvoryzae (strain DSM 22066 / NBRC 105507 / MRE50) TaxID=351160 RepID=DHQS_METAR|nr:3-dehydroquinate synthase II [Methanocella arvoryzae]Q0W131.1 RecName: Full=3-dehydroquinate synthase; Short=DHQ synthase; AltName: Full=3-dehydroquinate synthase II [Methanocella arvoryzae MRE50]CAJ37912.1 putative 3-dehydroquinate synthase [Methanocella arvoryzae MRE50]